MNLNPQTNEIVHLFYAVSIPIRDLMNLNPVEVQGLGLFTLFQSLLGI